MDQIWSYYNESHSKIKNIILKEIEISGGEKFNRDGDKISKTDYYECTNNSHLDKLNHRNYFWILDDYLENFYDVFREKYCVKKSRITNFWFQQYYGNDIHEWHFHGDSNLSFVYYLEISDENSVTEFFDIINRKIFKPNISEGDIIVFPSHIPHRSPRIITEDRKTIISWNMSFDLVDVDFFNF